MLAVVDATHRTESARRTMSIDLDAMRADACHCRQSVANPGPNVGRTYHFTDCRADDINELCDETERLRFIEAAARHFIDPDTPHEATCYSREFAARWPRQCRCDCGLDDLRSALYPKDGG